MGCNIQKLLYPKIARLEGGFRSFLRRYYFSYTICARLSGAKHQRVTDETDLIVEGFPRTANSYAVALVNQLLPDLSIAHHSHSIASIKEGIRLNKAVVILVREPRDTLASYATRRIDLRGSNLYKNLILGIVEYRSFYTFIIKNLDRVEIVDFEKLIQNPRTMSSVLAYCRIADFRQISEEELRIKSEEAVRQVKEYERNQGFTEKSSSMPSNEKKEMVRAINAFMEKHFSSELYMLGEIYKKIVVKAG
jgi:hypothetical protein